MPSFSYTAISKVGKHTKDTIEAASLEAAKNSLRAAGFSILEIKELSALNKDIELPFLGNPTAKDMAVFLPPVPVHPPGRRARFQRAFHAGPADRK